MNVRKPFLKSLLEIPKEEAHGGSGARQLMLSNSDNISTSIEAVTKGFLNPGAIFDWHDHKDIDEFFIVLKGVGAIVYEDGTRFDYKTGDVIYNPENLKHRIENTGLTESEFFFMRVFNAQ